MPTTPIQAYLPGFEVPDLFADFSHGSEACLLAPVVDEDNTTVAPQPETQEFALADGAPLKPSTDDELVEVLAAEAASAEADEQSETDEDTPRVRDIGDQLLSNLPEASAATFVALDQAPWPAFPADADDAMPTTGIERAKASAEAILLSKRLQEEGRLPTDDERSTLLRFSGWGAVSGTFTTDNRWQSMRDALLPALNEEEVKACKDTILSSHYTPFWLVQAVWNAVQNMGFKGGRVLDPSVGSGHFIGGAPSEIARLSEFHGCDIDPVALRIAKALYGHHASLTHGGYETLAFPEGYFDLAITNVPFATHGVACTARKPYSRWSLHNYFAARMLEHVREDGLVVLITSSYFMDHYGKEIREWVGNRAELLSALRLPSGTFRRSADTDVVTDLVFLRKRRSSELAKSTEAAWLEVRISDVPTTSHLSGNQRLVNEYFAASPDKGIGEWSAVRNQYGMKLAPVADVGRLPHLVQEAVAKLPQGVYVERAVAHSGRALATEKPDGLQPGSYVVRNNAVHTWTGFSYEPTSLTGLRARRVAELTALRDTLRNLLSAQADADKDAEVSSLRRTLNSQYDRYVKEHGFIMGRNSRLAFRADPDWPLLLSLEVWDEDEQKAHKSAIFTTSTAGHRKAPAEAASAEDAVLISESELGCINLEYIARLLGMDQQEALEACRATGAIYVNPETGMYESASQYLSGHIRNKLARAQSAGPAYATNVAALTKVLPQDLGPSDIEVSFGSIWVPAGIYEDFVASLVQNCPRITLQSEPITAAWTVNCSSSLFALDAAIGTPDVGAIEMLSASLHARPVTVYDQVLKGESLVSVVNVEKTAAARDKQEDLLRRFSEWLWSDPDRVKLLVRLYNDQFNSWVDRVYDGSRMRLPGYSWYHSPSPHQLNGARRIITGQNTLLGHCVGAGKTLTMQIGAMELRRLGLRRKPLHVVPNHMLEQYTGEFLRAYPNARVLMASKDDLSADGRKAFAARVATGDWDSIVMTHSAFERILPPPEASIRVMEDALSDLNELITNTQRGAANRTMLRQATRAKKEWEAKLKSLKAAWKSDNFLTLDQLGVDHLLIDEAHFFKNLFRISQMPRVAGLSDASSQRAFDMLVKTRAMMAMHGGKQYGVVFATGTFVANSLGEMHVMQRYLQPKTLEDAGLASFDAWARMFGRVVTSLEVSPDGSSFRMNERFAKFVNVPELMGMFAEVADIRTKQMLNLPTPALFGGQPQVIACDASPELKKYVEGLVERAEAVRNREVRPEVDNMLKITGDGRKAALDLRLVDPSAQFDNNGKIMAMVRKAHELWVESTPFRGTQVIFCDLGTPTGKGFSVYPFIRDMLVAAGVPAKEIAFIHDAKTDSAKANLFARVREGTIRFLLGSTGKMGVGTNVQTRLYALHHLDSPWRPADVEQREGRIERRGNMCEFIHIYRYVTSGSFDAYMWQTLAAKAGFIGQVMSGDRSTRQVEDANMAALSYEEVKAIACGNPLIRDKALVDAELRKLGMLANQHERSLRSDRYELSQIPHYEAEAKRVLNAIAADEALIGTDLDRLGAGHGDETDEASIEMLLEGIRRGAELKRSSVPQEGFLLGSFAGLPLRGIISPWFSSSAENGFALSLGKNYTQTVAPYRREATLRAALTTTLAERELDVERMHQRLDALSRQRVVMEARAGTPFPYQDRLLELRKRSEELEIELGLTTAAADTAALDENSRVASSEAASLVVDDVDGQEEAQASEAIEV